MAENLPNVSNPQNDDLIVLYGKLDRNYPKY